MARECPECGEELTYLNWKCKVSGWESGTVDEDGQWDTADSGTDDSHDYEYECPECHQSIDTTDPRAWLRDGQPVSQASTTNNSIWSNAQ